MKRKVHEGPHKYIKARFTKSRSIIFKCGLQGCTHFIYEPLIIGRESVCWVCNEIFEVIRKSIRNKKLHCEDCTRGKKSLLSKKELDLLMNG
jgi:hypothetical protein